MDGNDIQTTDSNGLAISIDDLCRLLVAAGVGQVVLLLLLLGPSPRVTPAAKFDPIHGKFIDCLLHC